MIRAFAPTRDVTWMERITPALHANIYAMYDALERIADHGPDPATRQCAHDALNPVFAWRAPAPSTEIAEEN